MKSKLFLMIQISLILLLSTNLFSQKNNKTDSFWQSIKLPSGQVAHLGTPNTIVKQSQLKTKKRQVNLIFILDASGSMNAELPGAGKTKLAVAKDVLGKIIPKIPSNIKGALWVYGHRYPQKPQNKSCHDIENVFHLGPIDTKAYVQKINKITAIGYTPIANAIKQAAETLPTDQEQYNTIILVSDGEETCGGAPCNIAETLKADKKAVTIHVVGYDVDKKTRDQLNCIAEESGGTYHDAKNASGLLQALENAMEATVSETIIRVELLKPGGKIEGEDITLYKAGNEMLQKIGRYQCWKDIAFPPGNYDLIIESLPWILYKNLKIDKNTTTIIKLNLGKIMVKSPDQKAAEFHLYDTQTEERFGFYSKEVLVAPGEYHLIVHNISTNPMFVNQGETEEIGLGTITAVSPNGKTETVTIFNPNNAIKIKK